MAKAKKRTKAKAKRAPARKKKAMKKKVARRSRKPAEQGFWANFFGAFAGPPSGKGS